MKSNLFFALWVGFLWLLTGSGLFAQSIDHSKSGQGLEHVHALATDGTGQALFLAAHTGLFTSFDEGKSWHKVNIPTQSSHLDVMAIAHDPGDPKTVYVGTHEAGVLKTTDGGKTWKEVNNGLGGLDVHGVAIDPNDGKLHALVREKGEGIYRSTNGGAKWTRVDDGPGGEVKGLYSVNLSTGMGGIFLYAATAEGLQRNPDCF